MVLLIAALVCAVFVNEAQATDISYGAIGKGGVHCRAPRKCPPSKPANSYTRGCEQSQRCRGGQSP
ncbi:Protein RALF-like 28 [Linum perenne]